MKRTAARLGLLALLVGVPLFLRALLGPPGLPSFGASGGLSDTYLPIEAVLDVLGLLTWALWAYLVLAILLHATAVLAASRGLGPHRGLLAASSLLTPKTLRHLVEFAVGGTLLAASVSMRVAASHPVPVAAPVVRSVEAAETIQQAPASAERPATQTYRVRPGDSLWRIAERELGSGYRWREIYRLNGGKQFSDGRCLTNPHLIYAGWLLELPGEATHKDRRPDARRVADEQRGTPEESAESPSPEPAPVMTAPMEEEPPPQPGRSHDGSEEHPEDEDADERRREPALRLPSGLLVAASFASGLLTAHLLGRLRRRRAWRPLDEPELPEPEGSSLVDDLRRGGATAMAGALEVSLEAVTEAWRAENGVVPRVSSADEGDQRVTFTLAGDGNLPQASGGNVSPLVRFAREGTTVTAEVTGPFPARLRQTLSPLERSLLVPLARCRLGSAFHVALLGLGPVSLVGPNAPALARQMVLASAAQGPPEDCRLILLGVGEELGIGPELPHVSGVHAWEDASDVLRELEIEFVRRARLFFEEGAEDLQAHLAEHSDDRLPAILVVAAEPPQALRGLLDAVGKGGPNAGVALLALGWRPADEGLHVRMDQRLELEGDSPFPTELEPFLLDAASAEEAVGIIRDAYPEEREEEPVLEQVEVPAQVGRHPAGAPDVPVEAKGQPSVEAVATSPTPDTGDDLELESLPVAGPPRDEEPEDGAAPPEGEVVSPPPDVPAVRTLGPLTLSRDGRVIQKGWRSKAREILAYLVAHPEGAPKDRIVEELWPDADPKHAANLFDKRASVVRSQARGPNDSRMYIEKAGEAFRLQREAWWVDAWEFERLIGEADGGPDPQEEITKLRSALPLYRGEFCDDSYYSWAEPIRERYRAIFIRVCVRLADLLSDAEERDEALSVLDRGVEVDPVCEDLYRRAMAIEASVGRRSAALARFRQLETTLDEHLGVEPDPETRSLARDLRRPGHVRS